MRLKLAELMERHHISQAQLAQALGIPRPTVNSWIAGQTKAGQRITVFPTYPVLERLCHFFRCMPNDMLELGDPVACEPTIDSFRSTSSGGSRLKTLEGP